MLFILLIKRWLRVAGPRELAVEPLLGGATCPEAGPRSRAQVGAAAQDPRGGAGAICTLKAPGSAHLPQKAGSLLPRALPSL